MTTPAAFWDNLAEKYARRPIGDVDSYEHTLARTRSHLAAGDNVLELGCGTGTTALKLANATGRYVATDFSEQMIAIGRRKQEDQTDAPAQLSFETTGITTAPEGPFDAVLAYNLLHLVPDLPEALDAIKSRVKPGGLLISKTVCLKQSSWFFKPMVQALRLFGKAPFVAFLTADDLERMITAHGFDIIETGTFPKKPAARFVVARRRKAQG